MLKQITSFINSKDFLLRVAILNVLLLAGLLIYGIVTQFSENNYENALSVAIFIGLRVFAAIVLLAISTLPYITGWYFNTKLDKKINLRITGLAIFLFMSYQFLHPLFTQNQLSFELGYIIIPIVINLVMVLFGSMFFMIEYIKKNRESNIAS